MEMIFDMPIGKDGRAHVRLYGTGDEYGLSLHDGNGNPMGNGRTLSKRQALALANDVRRCKPTFLKSLIWAALGYERVTRKPLASGMCHPGAIKLHGRP